MTTPSEMTTRVIDLICADPQITPEYKRGLKAAEAMRKEMEEFHLKQLYLMAYSYGGPL